MSTVRAGALRVGARAAGTRALGRCGRRLWRRHTATPAASVLSLAALLVLAQSITSAVRHLVQPAWHDIWDMVPENQRWLDGHYGWGDLVAPYYEHRIVLTKALLLLDASADRMNGRIPEAVAFALLAGLGLLVWRMVRLDAPAGAGQDTPPLFWIALLSAVSQYENIDLPFQVQFPIACFSAGAATLLLAHATLAPGRRAAWLAGYAGLAGIVAAFSMGSGVLLAPSLFVLLALRRARRLVWAVFAPISILGVVLFFQGHDRISQPGLPLLDWHLTAMRLVYSCNFLASSLGAFPALATWAGGFGLLVFGLVCAAAARSFVVRGKPVPAGDAALLALCLMVVLCAPAGTLTARLLMGAHTALASRYATMSLLFAATVLGLGLRWAARRPARRVPARRAPAGWAPVRGARLASLAVAAAGLAVLLLVNAPIYFSHAGSLQRVVLADAQLLVNNVGVEGRTPPIFGGTVDTVRGDITIVQARKLNIFDPAHGPPAALLARLEGIDLASLPACRGTVDAAYAVDSTGFLISGWLTDPMGQHTAPWIAALDAHGHLLGTARALDTRPDVAAALAMKEAAYGFNDGFRLRAPAEPGATSTVRLLALFPGVWLPICALSAPARIGPLQILPAARVQGAAAVALPAPPSLTGVVPTSAVAAWRSGVPAPDVPAWSVLAAGHPRLVFHLAPGQAGRALALPFFMADAASGWHLSVTMGDGIIIQTSVPTLWHQDEWRAVMIPADLLAQHGGATTLEVQADASAGLLVGAPVSGMVRPEWSRLF